MHMWINLSIARRTGPPGWNRFNNSCYFISTTTANWTNAQVLIFILTLKVLCHSLFFAIPDHVLNCIEIKEVPLIKHIGIIILTYEYSSFIDEEIQVYVNI